VKSVSAGEVHVCAILDDDSVRCWGNNLYGQLGNGTNTGAKTPGAAIDLGSGRSAKSISAGRYHTCAILDDDSLRCWGSNFYGTLGNGTSGFNKDTNVPGVAVNLGLGRSARSVSAGWNNTCAILDDKSLKCWGNNERGQLVTGDSADRNVPGSAINLGAGRTAKSVSVGNFHLCAVLDNDALKCWGSLTGRSQDAITSPTTVSLGPGRTARSVSEGLHHVCAILDDGALKCWGGNQFGALGDGTTTTTSAPGVPVNLGALRTAHSVSANRNRTCTVLDDNTLKCWGSGVGLGTTGATNTPGASIALGF
jgi:alpha-tubulin suppressor-like RCC1 family protein